jgi:transcriptional regulator with XRE-family HTH domain
MGLKHILNTVGLKQTELARLLDVSPRTVSMWATGEVNLPGPVAAYLRLLVAAGPDNLAAELGRLQGRHKMFDEGIYSLSYAAAGEDFKTGGDGLAVLRSGRIVGSDRWGGMFEGSYRFDGTSQTNHFHLRMQVPADGELVTGFTGGPEGATLDIVAVLERASPMASATIEIDGRAVDLKLTYLGPLPN